MPSLYCSAVCSFQVCSLCYNVVVLARMLHRGNTHVFFSPFPTLCNQALQKNFLCEPSMFVDMKSFCYHIMQR